MVNTSPEGLFCIPRMTKYGLDHKLKVLDLRFNQGVNRSETKRFYFDTVIIFAWLMVKKGKMDRDLNKPYKYLQMENIYEGQEKISAKFINLPYNPLHIILPTEDQKDFA